MNDIFSFLKAVSHGYFYCLSIFHVYYLQESQIPRKLSALKVSKKY